MNSAVDTNALIEENQQLHAELQDLLEQARINQQIMQRHQAFDLRLISASEFRDLIETVSRLMPQTFSLEVVTLTLIDYDFDIRRILHELQIGLDEYQNLLFLTDPTAIAPMDKPILGPYRAVHHRTLFPHYQPASIAILPLTRHQKSIGYLALGSAHEERFTGNLATDFIERLASVVTICLENVINNERLKHIGLTDQLTGVNNRRYIEQRLFEEIARAQRERSALACLYIDIDHFKRVNDQYGHQSGDEVLREVATRIKKELRLSDALGRFGGEEFVVLLVQATLLDAARIAERIRASVALKPIRIAGSNESGEENSGATELQITVSIGGSAQTPPDSSIPTDTARARLLAQADQALYRAKESGRNRVVVGKK
ncbi:diguanylate cyclase (GGDEF)-like protein [Herbaspirillum sp. Sphag1AN]|uniref:GGDEF domain-containing protein n=1 Tax=unclassified Herbaspirillum TaxID=2624150 RepID=UPI0016222BAE|nr:MULTISPECIES: sensor domain-containing diguanylate cyclase [unclassified Herbaspirillum]MBB3212634.1 diguanylate cyclase (GGDEF)-like protein [Herbaspirillum sp. Sphag1AN]MBB3245831.1 diguanylate cyclase (GGDEF)-like protein [Herbaspirillum sp. Sphag64]